jgi:hypothetical protein
MALPLHTRLSTGVFCPQEARIMQGEQKALLCPPDAIAISYTLLRHLGLMLDELSAQGLTVWQDEGQAWRWTWTATELQAEHGFWALGEAIVDAVVMRYPAAFDTNFGESAKAREVYVSVLME